MTTRNHQRKKNNGPHDLVALTSADSPNRANSSSVIVTKGGQI